MNQEGHYAEAGRVWKNVVIAFQHVDSEKEWVARAEQALTKLNDSAAEKKRLAPVWEALRRAEQLCDQGKREEADNIWNAVEELYRSDPAATEIINTIGVARKK
jgi:geranylgeranyl pyrophosphate synthase